MTKSSPGMAEWAPALANSAPAMVEFAPTMAKNENGDKDLIKEPATGGPCPTRACHRACPGGALVPGIGPGGRTVRWTLDGLKGRLCGSTRQASGAARVDDWRAVLRASNAVRDRKTWTLLGIPPPSRTGCPTSGSIHSL